MTIIITTCVIGQIKKRHIHTYIKDESWYYINVYFIELIQSVGSRYRILTRDLQRIENI